MNTNESQQKNKLSFDASRSQIESDLFQLSIQKLTDNREIKNGEPRLDIDTQSFRMGVQWVLDHVRDEDQRDIAGAIESAVAQAFNTKDPMIVAGALEASHLSAPSLINMNTQDTILNKSKALKFLDIEIDKNGGERQESLIEISELISEYKGEDLNVLKNRLEKQSGFHAVNRMKDPEGPLLSEVYQIGYASIAYALDNRQNLDGDNQSLNRTTIRSNISALQKMPHNEMGLTH